MQIIVSRFGKVNEEANRIVAIMEECYSRLAPHDVELVDLYVFERSQSVNAFMTRESEEVGVASAPFDDSFFAMHDAWRGTSRIILCVERLFALPRFVQEGGIRHEVGHSVLHGDLQYYLLPIPRTLLELAERFHLAREYAFNLLYLVSIAVKDFEVSRILTERGYIEDQLAYARHLLMVSESDRLSWRISKGKPLAEALCLVSCLKSFSCVVPFTLDKRFSEEMNRSLRESLSYLNSENSTKILDMVTEYFPSLGRDTINNINKVAKLTAERIVEPILTRGSI